MELRNHVEGHQAAISRLGSLVSIYSRIHGSSTDSFSLVALINMMKPNPANWPVFQVKPLPRLTSNSGKFLLMGDAAHAMAFYLSMGEVELFSTRFPSTNNL